MKRLFFLFSFVAAIAIALSSCDPKDTPETALGDVVSAKYDATTQSFVVKYSNGEERSYPAVIDNTTNTPAAGYALDNKTYLYAPQASVSSEATISEDINRVSQFVYDGMSTYYFWADDVLNKKPNHTDVNPANYFYKILNSTDTQKGWSWISDDVEEHSDGLEGNGLSFGYALNFVTLSGTIYAFVKYVHADTPAAKAGVERLDLIGKLNGNPITTEIRDGREYISTKDVNLLYGSNTVTFSTYKISGDKIIPNKEITITPDKSEKDPVLYDRIYTIGDKKIGYLFYTNYYSEFNDHLYEVFSIFKQAGVTDLVLDLRYNTGGYISSAVYLSSMIAPKTEVENNSPFVVMDYNNLLNTSFDKWYREAEAEDKYKYDRKDYLGTFNSTAEMNPLGANLDLKKVYIIATEDSYSASELTLFCLRPYMDVVHIGGNTGGKYTASWTIHAYDEEVGVTIYEEKDLSTSEKSELKNWAMQPIVAMYANKNSENFSKQGYLTPEVSSNKLEEGFGFIDYWTPIGDTKDVLLGQALYLISGDAGYLPVRPQGTRSTQAFAKKEIISPEQGKPVVIDKMKLTPEDFKKLQDVRK